MMSNFKIHATLAICPKHDCGEKLNIIVKGSTAILNIDLTNIAYLTDYDSDKTLDFKQLTVIIKEPNKHVLAYDYYVDGTADNHFNYDPALNKIEFILSATETSDLQVSDICAPTQWEVTIVTKDDYTIIQKQKPIIVNESLYNENQGANISEQTLCSSTLVCNN